MKKISDALCFNQLSILFVLLTVGFSGDLLACAGLGLPEANDDASLRAPNEARGVSTLPLKPASTAKKPDAKRIPAESLDLEVASALKGMLPDVPIGIIAEYAKPLLQQLALGSGHSLALLADGTVKALGNNDHGQLGDGSTSQRVTPARVDLGSQKALAVAAGGRHSLALLADGAVMAFGSSARGQLGNGRTTERVTPVRVDLGDQKALAVAAGFHHSLVLLADGAVVAFGDNDRGQLGDGSSSHQRMPVRVDLGGRKALAVAAGYDHSLVLLADGAVMAFGRYFTFPMSLFSTSLPVLVNLGGQKALAVAAGHYHSLVLLADGTVMAFGGNDYGPLGDGSTSERVTPARVDLGSQKALAVAAGSHHSLVLLADGAVMAFGLNDFGQLGDGSTSRRVTPVRANLGNQKALAVAAGGNHSFVQFADGTAMAFGGNEFGELGDQKAQAVAERSPGSPRALP